jgi:hypothetical protein
MLTTLALVLQVAAATPTPAPAPAPAPARLSGGFGAKATPARARLVITDDTLATTRRGTFSVAGTTQPVAPVPAEDSAALAAPADMETVWRERVARLRSDLAAAEAEEAAMSAQITVVAGRPGRDYHMMMAIRNATLAPIRAKVSGLQRDLRALPEECRQTAGCQPGWIR